MIGQLLLVNAMMLVQRLIEGLEERAYNQRVKALEAQLPCAVGSDENNIFSLQEVLDVPDVDVVSFDFFDTLFFRQNLCLEQVMEKTSQLSSTIIPGDSQDILASTYSSRGFTSRQLKRLMQSSSSGDEPTLEDIIARALRKYVKDKEKLRSLSRNIVGIETAVELSNLVPNDQILSVFRNLRLLGKRVFITSDMYLPSASLKAVLEKHKVYDFVDELIVSSEFGITKHSGDLFQIVVELAGVRPDRILHIGDNWTNDVVRARENGINAFHYYNYRRESDVKRIEKKFELPCPDSVRKSSISESYAIAKQSSFDTLDEIIFEVIGPACALFVHDVLHRAIREESSHIFFLTRDGTIFKDIADAFRASAPALYPCTAKFHVLASSRTTGTLLGVDRYDSDYLYTNTEYLTEKKFRFSKFLNLFNVPKDQINELSEETRYTISRLGDDMSLESFRSLYWERQDLQDLLMDIILRQKQQVVDYLRDAGLFGASSPILVDIGYSGTWGKQLSHVFEELEHDGACLPNVSFDFFATNRFFSGNIRDLHPSISMRPGRILDHRRKDCLTASLNFSWLEPFFLDPNLGKLKGFSNRTKIEPNFATSSYGTAERIKLEGMRHSLVGRCQKFVEDLISKEGDIEELRRLVVDRLVKLACYPTKSEALAISSLTHERGMNSVSQQEIAVHLKPNELRKKVSHLVENDHWVQGSLARSNLSFLNHFISWYYGKDKPAFVDWRP